MGGAGASWLVRSSPDRAVLVRALAGDIVLCSWTRHFTLTVPLSIQVYKWVTAKLMQGVTLRWTQHPIQEGVEILQLTSCYRNQDNLRPDGPVGSYVVTLVLLNVLLFSSRDSAASTDAQSTIDQFEFPLETCDQWNRSTSAQTE